MTRLRSARHHHGGADGNPLIQVGVNGYLDGIPVNKVQIIWNAVRDDLPALKKALLAIKASLAE
jgi:hypothetical protein